MTDLSLTLWGTEGERVVLVHGDGAPGSTAFAAQRPLAERWQLVIPDRRGFGQTPPAGRQDFERDALDIAAVLGDGAHLVGNSYGGVVSLLAAALRPAAVRSLTVSEPPAFGVARGSAAVETFVHSLSALYGRASTLTPRGFFAEFLPLVGGDASSLPDPLPPERKGAVRMLMNERRHGRPKSPSTTCATPGFPR